MAIAISGPRGTRKPDRVPIGGLQIDRAGLPDVAECLSRFVEERTPRHVVTANLQFVSLASRNRPFADAVNRADLVVADGMPLVWLSRLSGNPLPQRITGHDLLHLCARLAVERGYSIAFLGARPDVAAAAARRLGAMHPGLNFLGAYQGSFSAEGYGLSDQDERGLVERLRRDRPDFLFVALGCPKQEFWISRHLQAVDIPVCVGIGGVLDVLAGKLRRAPSWVQRAGLEWSYRMYQEPGRLWKRYLLESVPTLARLGVLALLARSYTFSPLRTLRRRSG